jgi:hypothetical protein
VKNFNASGRTHRGEVSAHLWDLRVKFELRLHLSAGFRYDDIRLLGCPSCMSNRNLVNAGNVVYRN